MSSNDLYRTNAEDCLRMAQTAQNETRPFWLNLAQSWLKLAEHSARNGEFEKLGGGPHAR